MIGDEIVIHARECVGTPFGHQGRRAGQALDCAGVVVHAVRAAGVECVDVVGYARNPHGGVLESTIDMQTCLERVPVADIAAGDILLMRFTGSPQHLGVWTGSTLIHAYESVGRCVEHVMDDKWRKRIVRAYRVAEVCE